MIKYFSFEKHFGDNTIKNVKVLDKDPMTNIYGWNEFSINGGSRYFIDVERRIQYYGKLDEYTQEIYDKLLVEVRNKKLETL